MFKLGSLNRFIMFTLGVLNMVTMFKLGSLNMLINKVEEKENELILDEKKDQKRKHNRKKLHYVSQDAIGIHR